MPVSVQNVFVFAIFNILAFNLGVGALSLGVGAVGAATVFLIVQRCVAPRAAPELVVDAQAELGEGPIWDPRNGTLLWLDILASKLFVYSPTTGTNTVHDLSAHTPSVSTVVPVEGTRSQVVLGVQAGFALYDLKSRKFEPHPCNGALHGAHTRMNDGKCDPQGRLWLGSIARSGPGGADLVPGASALYVLEGWASVAPTKVLDGVTVSNGITWSEDGRTMLYTDSPTFGVDAFDFDGGAASHAELATRRRRAIDVCSGFPPVPDGCALDTQGMLWVACFGAGEVRRYDPANGRLIATVALPAAAGKETTACAFGGAALDELYVTTAHEFWDAGKRAEMPLAGGLFKLSRAALAALGGGAGPIRGVPMHPFKP